MLGAKKPSTSYQRHTLSKHAGKENNVTGQKPFSKVPGGKVSKTSKGKPEKQFTKATEKQFGKEAAGKQQRVALQDRTNGLKRKSENVLSRSTCAHHTNNAATKKAEGRNPNKKPRTNASVLEPAPKPAASPAKRSHRNDNVVMMDTDFSTASLSRIEDIDDPSRCSDLEVPEYSASIIQYLFDLEKRTRVSPGYLLVHKEVNEEMRSILVNWMFEVHLEFRTLAETLFLAVGLLDRYLEANITLSRRRLQLIGMATMFIACKYEQTYLPTIADFTDICAEAYSGDELLDAEGDVLRVIEWDLSAVTPKHFLKRFSKASGLNNKQFCFASYFIELTLPEYSMLVFPPSMIAAAAIFVTRKTCALEPIWTPTIQHYTTYTEEQIRPCAKQIITIIKREASRFAKSELEENGPITIKYSSLKFFGVAPESLGRVSRNMVGWREGKGEQGVIY